MSTSLGIIKKFVDTLVKTKKQGNEAADEAFKAVGAVNYSTFRAKINDARSGYSDQDFLEQVCGIRINNTDTGAITGSDAGYSKTSKTAESIVPETAAAKNLTAAEYNSFTKNGLTVNITYNEISEDDEDEIGSNFGYSAQTYLEKQKLVTRALYNWWIPASLDLINQSLGVNFTDGRANINEINIVFHNEMNDEENEAVAIDFNYDMGYASKVTLRINSNFLYNITENDKNGTLNSNKCIWSSDNYTDDGYSLAYTNYLDRLILQAMAEITLKANIPYFYYLPKRITNGLCEIVDGFDDSTTSFNSFTSNLSYNDDDNAQYNGYVHFRYLAKNYADGVPDEYDGGDTMPAGLSYNSAKTVLTATTKFTGSAIDLSNFASSVKTVNASKLTKAVKITGNDNNNSIIGGSGADTLDGAAGNDTLTGGKGNDVFVYSGGNDIITDYASGDKISLGAAISKAAASGSNVVLTVGSGKLTIKGGKGKSLSMIDSAGNSFTTVVGGSSSGGSTNLTVTDKTKSPVTIASSVKTVNASKRTKAVQITGNKLANSIAGGAGKDYLYGGAGNDTILGNAGNDKLYGQAGNDYLSGGKGNDSIAGGAGNNTLTGGAGNDVFFYGGGNDVITDYAEGDKIKIASGFVSSINPSGNDVVFTVGKGKITVTGAADKTITYIDANGEQDYSDSPNAYNIKGSTIKLMPTYLNETFNIADYGATLQNVDASAVLLDMEITGNALRNSILGGENNETLIGGKGNDTLTGGTGSDVFLYNNGDGNDVITDYSEEDFIQFTTGTAKVKRSGKDVIFTLGKGTITVTGGASKIITYADAKGEHSYPEVVDINGAGTKITLLENYIKDTFDVADYDDGIKTIDASAVAHDLEITGNKLMNSMKGGAGNDTLWGDKGNDTLTGGNGSDVFVYSSGDGNDVITDYNEEDKIKIASGKVSVKKSGKNVVFTVGSGKITVTGAASKTITYIDANDKTNYFPTTPSSSIIWKDKNTTAILRETYSKTTFTAADYNASIKKIDASSVTHNIKITGNGKANVIMGGYENDTILGGKGNDTLQGGSGADVFTYANGDGKDIILDYAEEDKIQITKGTAKVAKSGSDVIFTIGSGKITLLGAANKTVSYIEGGKTKTYGSSTANVLEDDNFITGNDLSSLVKEKAIDYSLAEVETSLTSAKALQTLTYSSKK